MAYAPHIPFTWDWGIWVLDGLGVLPWLKMFLLMLSQLIAGGFMNVLCDSTLGRPLKTWPWFPSISAPCDFPLCWFYFFFFFLHGKFQTHVWHLLSLVCFPRESSKLCLVLSTLAHHSRTKFKKTYRNLKYPESNKVKFTMTGI